MARYDDPTVLHPAECNSCGKHVRDADVLDDDGDCPACVEEKYQDECYDGDDD